jgi:hypothetical protein
MRYLTILWLITIIITGCATKAINTQEAIPVPKERILNRKYLSASEGAVPVTIKRDKGFFGSGCSQTIMVDGEDIAVLYAGEKIVFHLNEGEHIIGLRVPRGLCGGSQNGTVVVITNSGKPIVFRTHIGSSGGLSIFRTPY